MKPSQRSTLKIYHRRQLLAGEAKAEDKTGEVVVTEAVEASEAKVEEVVEEVPVGQEDPVIAQTPQRSAVTAITVMVRTLGTAWPLTPAHG